MNILPYRLLVVEDDDDFAEVLRQVLAPIFSVELAGTFAEASARLARFDKLTIEVVLLDLKLPNGMGKELVTKFQAANPSIPLVVISGYDFGYQEMIEAGAQDYIAKPADVKEILDKLLHSAVRHRVRQSYIPIRVEIEMIRGLNEKSISNLTEALDKPSSVRTSKTMASNA